MHELSVASAVLTTALQHAGKRRVTTVAVRAGQMRQVVPESLRFYFEIVARDTPCEGAELRLEEVRAELACEDCARCWSPGLASFRCPACGSGRVRVRAGEELEVDYIEIEDEEAACTAPG